MLDVTKELFLLSLLTLSVVSGQAVSSDDTSRQQQSAQERLDHLRSLPYISAPVDPKARTGLLGMHESEVTDFSNHKKYVVDTELQFGDLVDGQGETGKK